MEKFEDLSPRIQGHLRSVAGTSGLPNAEQALEVITQNWLEKHRLFQGQTSALKMLPMRIFMPEDPWPILLLTYSGSLIALGTLVSGGRSLEYFSIKLRLDIPDWVRCPNIRLDQALKLDEPGIFSNSGVSQCSDLLMMAVCPEDMPLSEQEKRMREAVIFLTNGFAKINRTLTLPTSDLEHFTQKNMVQFLAKKNDLTQGSVKQLLEDYNTMVEAGVLLGESVPLGKLGKVFLSRKKAQKARVGRNPLTGEEITISAKPETFTPRFRFSKSIKEKAQRTLGPGE